MINFADKKEWASSRKQLIKRRLTKEYKFAIATHHACDNRIVHVSKKHLSKEIIKQNLNNNSCRQYIRHLNDGAITYRKLTNMVR